MPFRVIDLFCGPGGISEGLRQAGFKTVYALDHDRAAVDTFSKNHPEAHVIREDVTSLDVDALPAFDIMVGGPPCVEFSSSKGSRGNILEGLRLVQEYLRAVYLRSPRYWIMENVPRIMRHLPEEIPLKWIGINKPGALHVPTKAEFNCADYGVPQTRRRFLMGNFPVPLPTHEGGNQTDLFSAQRSNRLPWRTLGDALSALPDPVAGRPSKNVTDPNYDLTIAAMNIMDHFHPVLLSDQEVRSIRRAKVDHPFMGRMAFPDATDRPARTVVATQLGRETLVIGALTKDGPTFRRATVRECAVLQTFPISYQFFGGSLNTRYRLAGDAVPPRLAFLIAQEICRVEGVPVPASPKLLAPAAEPAPPITVAATRRRINFPLQRRFSELVPGKEVRGCRAELDNRGENPGLAQLAGGRHVVEWCSRLYMGEGTASLRTKSFTLDELTSEIAEHCRDNPIAAKAFRQLLQRAEKRLVGRVPDATTAQAIWAKKIDDGLGPDAIVDVLSELVNITFPADTYSNQFVRFSNRFDLIPEKGLRVRIVAALLVTAYCCELLNVDARWVGRHPSSRFIPDDWSGNAAIKGKNQPVENVPSPAERFDTRLRSLPGSKLSRGSALLARQALLDDAH